MITSTDSEKAFNSTLHAVITKTLRKIWIEVKFFNMVNNIWEKTQITSYSTVKDQNFSSNIKSNIRMLTFTAVF